MTGSLTTSMRDQVVALLADQTSLLEFKDWLVGATWDIEQHADPEAIDLAYSSKLALPELTRGDIGEAAFRERMRALVGTPVLPR